MARINDEQLIRILKNLGLKVKAFREKANLTYREFAENLGISVYKLKRIEKGEVDIHIWELTPILEALSMPVKMLFNDDPVNNLRNR